MVSQPGQGPVPLVTEGKEKDVSKTEDKLGIMVFNCLHGQAPQYLVELCQPVAGVVSRQHLLSAAQWLLVVPLLQLSSYGQRVF